ncbi:hypothetical protein [Flavobacterium chungangensis]|uniref:Uncharacterized protein n=1 Tax=Flavobacterium chungangensis TaxID=2708132 RepID=A0ABV8ZIG1_9FLAO
MKKFILLGLLITYINIYSQEKKDDFKRLIDSALTIKSIDTYSDFKEDLNKDNQTDNWKHHIEEYKHYIENIYLVDENPPLSEEFLMKSCANVSDFAQFFCLRNCKRDKSLRLFTIVS